MLTATGLIDLRIWTKTLYDGKRCDSYHFAEQIMAGITFWLVKMF